MASPQALPILAPADWFRLGIPCYEEEREGRRGHFPDEAFYARLSAWKKCPSTCEFNDFIYALLMSTLDKEPGDWVSEMLGLDDESSIYIDLSLFALRFGILETYLEDVLGYAGYMAIPRSGFARSRFSFFSRLDTGKQLRGFKIFTHC